MVNPIKIKKIKGVSGKEGVETLKGVDVQPRYDLGFRHPNVTLEARGPLSYKNFALETQNPFRSSCDLTMLCPFRYTPLRSGGFGLFFHIKRLVPHFSGGGEVFG